MVLFYMSITKSNVDMVYFNGKSENKQQNHTRDISPCVVLNIYKPIVALTEILMLHLQLPPQGGTF
jgi:hypothetical protein